MTPPIADERGQRFGVRLNTEERAMLDALAKADGLTGSDFVRLSIRRAYAEKFGTKKPKK